jgi:class 3 adenylate cyclase
MKLDEKLELIKLIAKAEDVPDQAVLQTFLIQQLVEKEGVRFVDIESLSETETDPESSSASQFNFDGVDGLYTMELCGDFGFCAPVMDPNASDRALKIVRILGRPESGHLKRLIVRVNFDSFLEPIKQMELWHGSTGCLVTSTGQLLAHTHKSMSDRRRLGETGNEFELRLLEAIRHQAFGTVWGKGHPPDLIASFYKMPSINWYLVLFTQGNVLLGPIVQFRDYYMLGGILCLIVILLIIRFMTRSVAASISTISLAAAKVAEGDYTVQVPVTSNDEIGTLSSGFNNMIEGLQKRELIEQTFGRYVDKNIAAELMSRPEALKLGGQKRTVSIMMSDLRNFTGISEKLPPEVVIKMLNRYFARMISVIEHHKGIIVDFYGDSILVFFDGIEADVEKRALDAVQCAIEMQSSHHAFVQENIDRGLPEINMGIGVHTGEVIVGNIGTESRAKYGIVGSDVNLTDRIQATASAGKVIISESTYELIKDKLMVSLQFTACLKGLEDQKKLYEIEAIH